MSSTWAGHEQSAISGRHVAGQPPSSASLHGRMSFAENVEVLVGAGKTKLFVRPDIIQSRSPFFDAALKRWKKANEPVVLEEEDPATLSSYLQILYTSALPPYNSADQLSQELVDIYILADKLGDLVTANMTIDWLIQEVFLHDNLPKAEVVLKAWSSTAALSPLRRLIMDWCVRHVSAEALTGFLEREDTPRDFANGVVSRFAQLVNEKKKGTIAEVFCRHVGHTAVGCTFHQHDATLPPCQPPTLAEVPSDEGYSNSFETSDSESGWSMYG